MDWNLIEILHLKALSKEMTVKEADDLFPMTRFLIMFHMNKWKELPDADTYLFRYEALALVAFSVAVKHRAEDRDK